ncbi:nitrogen regulation protein NR(I) [Parasutterella muris]|uniref:DNA-binding transcriptional regulator NtrC n=2 Tax=Parasutterella TaxID=577310 RepID=A0A6L6YDB0_9BURK|nr:nitrogen regulation protein NR(I) [Parasutterella muris]MVX55660.1 nitrogen regulation protein NR(I) [Parasutterella muris]
MKDIWIADDDRSIRWVLEKALKKAGLPCRTFSEADSLLLALKTEQPSVILSDIRMPGKSGLEMLTEIKRDYPKLPVIIMTAFSDLDSAVSSFQSGAFEYLPKPFDIDKAVELVRRASEENASEEAAPEQQVSEIIGKASAIQDVFRAIGRLSHSKATVLLTGESGAGKEVVARALHKHSPRAKEAFIALNMAAIPRDLMESELFGHEKGAFTGANSVRHGRFEQAEGGTLFLDEIGDMPAELQTRLLRVLSDGYYYRVGGHQALKANVRIIAATHQNLENMVHEGRFREDLYHRLNVIRIRLPPLRERKEDIPLLIAHFLKKSSESLDVEQKIMTTEAMDFLKEFPFPGNVRQLENLCNWLVVMAPSQHIQLSDLPAEILQSAPAKAVSAAPLVGGTWQDGLRAAVEAKLKEETPDLMKELTDAFETAVIETALEFTHGRRVEAASRLGIGRNTITRKIAELNLKTED